jgi:hypothetical protein
MPSITLRTTYNFWGRSVYYTLFSPILEPLRLMPQPVNETGF